MAGEWVIDTNVYIHALRDPAELRALKAFVAGAADRVRVHATVVLELSGGARTHRQHAALEDLISAYIQRGLILVPSFAAHIEAGRVLVDLANKERVVLATAPRSFTNDVLIATSCREEKARLITNNHADFIQIKRHLRAFSFYPPWP